MSTHYEVHAPTTSARLVPSREKAAATGLGSVAPRLGSLIAVLVAAVDRAAKRGWPDSRDGNDWAHHPALAAGSSWDLMRVRRAQRREVRRWLATNPPSRGRHTGARC